MNTLISNKDLKKILICLSIYLTALLASNTLGLKTMPFIFGTHLSVAIFFFPIVYLMTDVISEVYSKQLAKQFVLAGFVATVLFILYNTLSIYLPWSEKSIWVKDSYNMIYDISLRMSLASVVAFVVAEYQDVYIFSLLKEKIYKKKFWFRSLISNIWSEALDTFLWYTIAFVGIYSFKTLILMMIPWYIYKVLIGFLYTPLSYTGIYLLKNHAHKNI